MKKPEKRMDNERKKIILVDDNMSHLIQGKKILKAFYEVYPTPSAKNLFEVLKNIRPDLILLDIRMPGVDGYEAIKILKADKCFADIPVILLTDKNDTDREQEGFDLGAADYITKPFSAPLLLKRVEKELAFVQKTKDLIECRTALKNYASDVASLAILLIECRTALKDCKNNMKDNGN